MCIANNVRISRVTSSSSTGNLFEINFLYIASVKRAGRTYETTRQSPTISTCTLILNWWCLALILQSEFRFAHKYVNLLWHLFKCCLVHKPDWREKQRIGSLYNKTLANVILWNVIRGKHTLQILQIVRVHEMLLNYTPCVTRKCATYSGHLMCIDAWFFSDSLSNVFSVIRPTNRFWSS